MKQLNKHTKNTICVKKFPVRILYILGGTMNFGGIESYVMNYYRHFDLSKIQLDFVIHGYGKGVYDDEILKMGGRIFHVPVKTHNPIKNFIDLYKICKSYPYHTIHVHMDAMSYVPLLIAKQCGIPQRISHSHNTNHLTNNKLKIWLNDYAKSKIVGVATHLFACSQAAGEWLYGKQAKFQVIPNAIDTKKFAYDAQKRNSIRQQLGLTETNFVVGHVGRFDYQKNHPFLLQIFHEIYKQNKNARLVCIGKGDTKAAFEEQINRLGLQNQVFILSPRPNVNEYYNAFDCFLLPSHFEGLGIVAIEAQCNGLPCFISDGVPLETMLCNTVRIPLSKTPKQWANIISNKISIFTRKDSSLFVKRAGYDICDCVLNLEKNYLKNL